MPSSNVNNLNICTRISPIHWSHCAIDKAAKKTNKNYKLKTIKNTAKNSKEKVKHLMFNQIPPMVTRRKNFRINKAINKKLKLCIRFHSLN